VKQVKTLCRNIVSAARRLVVVVGEAIWAKADCLSNKARHMRQARLHKLVDRLFPEGEGEAPSADQLAELEAALRETAVANQAEAVARSEYWTAVAADPVVQAAGAALTGHVYALGHALHAMRHSDWGRMDKETTSGGLRRALTSLPETIVDAALELRELPQQVYSRGPLERLGTWCRMRVQSEGITSLGRFQAQCWLNNKNDDCTYTYTMMMTQADLDRVAWVFRVTSASEMAALVAEEHASRVRSVFFGSSQRSAALSPIVRGHLSRTAAGRRLMLEMLPAKVYRSHSPELIAAWRTAALGPHDPSPLLAGRE